MRQVQRIIPKDREEWHRMRMEDFTASAVGALFGSHKYSTLRSIAAEKCAARPPDESQMSKVLRRGRIMEPAIAQAMRVDHGIELTAAPAYLRMRDESDPHLRIGATKDFQAFETAERISAIPGFDMPAAWSKHVGGLPMSLACELKSVSWQVFQNEWGDGPPLYHYAQAATQALLAGDDGALIIALVGEFLDLHIYPVVRSAAFEETLCNRVSEFWQRVEAGEVQPAQAGDPAKSLFPEPSPGAVVDLNGVLGGDLSSRLGPAEAATGEVSIGMAKTLDERATWSDTLSLRSSMKTAMKAYKSATEEIDEALKLAIGEAERARITGWKVTWKKTKAGHRTLYVREDNTK